MNSYCQLLAVAEWWTREKERECLREQGNEQGKIKNIIVGCIYKHPRMSAEEFNNQYMSHILENISFEYK